MEGFGVSLISTLIVSLLKWLFGEDRHDTAEDSPGFDADAAMRKRIRDEWMLPHED